MSAGCIGILVIGAVAVVLWVAGGIIASISFRGLYRVPSWEMPTPIDPWEVERFRNG